MSGKHLRARAWLGRLRIYQKQYASLLVRSRVIKEYFGTRSVRKLQIGGGTNCLDGWLNTDWNPSGKTVFLDATKKLPFQNCVLDYIFMEHLFEHLNYIDGVKLLMECYRVLKPGGKIRVSTLDLAFITGLYGRSKNEIEKMYMEGIRKMGFPEVNFNYDAFAINQCFRGWGHKFIYDYETLKAILEHCGFVGIKRFNLGESDDDNLKDIECHRFTGGNEDFTKLESMILEGTRERAKSRRTVTNG